MSISSSDRRSDTLSGRRAFLRMGGITVLGLAGVACSDSSSSSSASSSPSSSPSPPSAATGSPSSTSPVDSAAPSTAPVTPASSESTDTVAVSSTTRPALTAADFDGLGTCSLMPEKTAGPFPLEQQFDRRDVTEGLPGHPMRLGLRVVDASCAAVPGATVEIWHADATGDYSAFTDNGGGKDEGAGTTFLRGTQTTDGNGIVEFLTIYPGWYRGRAVHIHLRVHLADATVLTSQVFFDGDYTAGVYAAAPYAEFGLPDTSNEADNIAGDPAAEGTLLHTSAGDTTIGAGTLGLLNLGIDASTQSSGAGGAPNATVAPVATTAPGRAGGGGPDVPPPGFQP